MTPDASVRTYCEISAEELVSRADALADEGRRWHFHIATAGCAIAGDRSGITFVLEDPESNVVGRAVATQDDVATIGGRLARRLHGSDVVDQNISEPTDNETSPEMEALIAAAQQLSEETKPWHHHMLFPDCAFNPNPGLWTLQLEAGESTHVATSSSEPRAALSVIEKLFYAQKSIT